MCSIQAVLVVHAASDGAAAPTRLVALCFAYTRRLRHAAGVPRHNMLKKKGGGESRSMSPVVISTVIEGKCARPSRSAAPSYVPPPSSADIRADASATPTMAHASMLSGNSIWNPPGYGRIAGNAAPIPDYHDLGASRREINVDTVPLFRTPASHTHTAPTWASSPLPYGGDSARQMAAVPVSSVTAGQRSQSFAPITYDTEVWRVTC